MIATLALLYLACCFVFVLHVLRAPRGREDETGFHLCPDEPMPALVPVTRRAYHPAPAAPRHARVAA